MDFQALTAALYRLRYEWMDRLRVRPWPYLPMVRRWRRDADGRPKAVTRATGLVIEGYPRSGNTFARIAFEGAQARPVTLAHHLHAPAQVVAAVRLGVACLVLIREPDEAVLSQVVRDPRLALGQALRSYARFHEAIEPVRQGFVLARFETVTGDFARVIEAVNGRFGTDFALPASEGGQGQRVRDRLDAHDEALGKADSQRGRPTESRTRSKQAMRAKLEDSSVRSLRSRAQAVYGRLVAGADV